MKTLEMWRDDVKLNIDDAKEEMNYQKSKITKLLEENDEYKIAIYLPEYSKSFSDEYKKIMQLEKELRNIESVMKDVERMK